MPHEFAAGARGCIGRRCEQTWSVDDVAKYSCVFFFRFFETESIAAITMMVSRYKIEIKEEPQFAGETFEERYARVTAFTLGLTNA